MLIGISVDCPNITSHSQHRTKLMKKRTLRFITIAGIFILIITVGIISCRKSRISEVEANLGISIPARTRVSGSTNFLGQDYEKELTLKFTEKGLNALINQIEQTEYFNLHHTFHGMDEVAWKKSDTAFYWTVREYLGEKHLTGYWMKNDSSTIVFHEPDFSDIPNSALLFDEAFQVEAELFVKERKLVYRFIKF